MPPGWCSSDSEEGAHVAEAESPSPLIYRRRLRAELRKARQEAGLTQEKVAAEMDWSLSKIIRIENGEVSIAINDLRAVLPYYGISDSRHVDELLDLARAAKQRSWWSRFSRYASPQFIQFVEFENSAATIRNFEPQLVPGLLQTEEYARVATSRFADEHNANKLLELRMKRQELVVRKAPPKFYFLINEEVVRRGLGGPTVMESQIQKLIDMAARENVTLQVIPFDVGVFPGMHNPFVIHEFPDAVGNGTANNDALYVENPRGDLISYEKPEEIIFYREVFGQLQSLALDSRGSISLLNRVSREYAGRG